MTDLPGRSSSEPPDAADYSDGAEQRITSILRKARDRSDGSDELAQVIVDWETRYHLSPLRANLLRPLNIRSGLRVLEVGCGTGVLSRWLGEQGASVTALEPVSLRAEAARLRCEGLDNVTTRECTVDELDADEEFDLVIVVGVLEHVAGQSDQPNVAAARFLQHCVSHLSPDGAIALAIENQLGMKYLLGYSEDHRGLPWIGVEGYPTPGAQTWSRAGLRSMLAAQGLSDQRWLYPFPDYKLPTTVLSEQLYDTSGADSLIDGFVRVPASEDAGQATFVCDARSAHRVLLSAGLGPDVANSFLVVASRSPSAVEGFVGDHLAWLFGSHRLRQWRRGRVVERKGGNAVIRPVPGSDREASFAWLSQTTPEEVPVWDGRTMDDLLSEHLDRGNLAGVQSLLKLWRTSLVQSDSGSSGSSHPFRPIPGEIALAANQLDVSLSNFIVDDSLVHNIDMEWIADGPISENLAVWRALWYFASGHVAASRSTPWGPVIPVDLLCCQLASVAGLTATVNDLDRMRSAEANLQQLVVGADPYDQVAGMAAIGRMTPIDAAARSTPVNELHATLNANAAVIRSLQEELEDARRVESILLGDIQRLLQAVRVERSTVDELHARLVDSKAKN